MSPDVERAIEAIRALPWRGIEFVRPPDAPEPPRPERLGPTAAPRPLGETSTRLLELLRANPGWHRTRHLADGVGEPSRRICSAMEPLVERGLVARRPAGKEGGRGRAGVVYRALGVALSSMTILFDVKMAAAHDWFSGLRAPNGIPCCSDTTRECHTTSMCVATGGLEGVETKGWGCIPVPLDKVLPMSSPDGKPAVCESPVHGPAPVVYCVMLPGAARLSRPDRSFAEAGL